MAESPASHSPDESMDDLDALLAESGDEADPDGTSDADDIVLAEDDEEDLDAMLAALGANAADQAATDADNVEVALDEDMDLDTELEALLGSVDDDIALDESGADDEDRGFEDMGFLEGTDEVETKLDLARAYIDMEDRDGAKDILSEILSEGSDVQQQEARKLMESIA
jgi:pilus assembly protein FimV